MGLLVTLVGAAIVVVVTATIGNPIVANAVGYAFGLLLSYALNSRYTFGQSQTPRNALRFITCFAIAFAANLIVVYLVVYQFSIQKIIGSLAGLPIYTITFYFLCEKWAFVERARD
ncbi:GtrA family protein [Pseudoxanthomonas broegbernensis]|uniref:GtrA family protein n=1 Tax=Pseudoxanthomonas broegbernensis TaxID=83619 RepID=UPI001391898B|nr:GtrA family protein [Pseudoxanthomonas broegbernensis]MBB6066337.1 putative flippase GtrA [Pseudoxanthomonas broegbernensis]